MHEHTSRWYKSAQNLASMSEDFFSALRLESYEKTCFVQYSEHFVGFSRFRDIFGICAIKKEKTILILFGLNDSGGKVIDMVLLPSYFKNVFGDIEKINFSIKKREHIFYKPSGEDCKHYMKPLIRFAYDFNDHDCLFEVNSYNAYMSLKSYQDINGKQRLSKAMNMFEKEEYAKGVIIKWSDAFEI
jgi:hypothetical protein